MTSLGAAPHPRLVADIGGTGCRLGRVEREGSDVADIVAFDAGTAPEAAIAQYLARPGRPRPRAAALGVAAPVLGDTVQLTNRAWSFSVRELERRLGLERLVVLNDFAALAHALPLVQAAEVLPVGGGRAAEGAPMAIVGPGTGLGVSGLVPGPRGPAVVVGEGGHVSLAAATPREDASSRSCGAGSDTFPPSVCSRARVSSICTTPCGFSTGCRHGRGRPRRSPGTAERATRAAGKRSICSSRSSAASQATSR